MIDRYTTFTIQNTFKHSTQLTILDSKKGKWRFVLLTGLFAFLFVNIFEPYGTYTTATQGPLNVFLEISIAIVLMMLTQAGTQFLLRPLFKISTFTWLSLIPWFILELLLITLVWTVLTVFLEEAIIPFPELFVQNLTEGLFLISPAWWGTLFLLHYRHRLAELRILREATTQAPSQAPPPMDPILPIRDKAGQEKLSLRQSNLLFLESSDNYVTIHFLENSQPKKLLVRNTLKNLELDLAAHGILRCHRSYLINPGNVIRKEKTAGGFRLYLKSAEGLSVPVSKSYTSEIEKRLK